MAAIVGHTGDDLDGHFATRHPETHPRKERHAQEQGDQERAESRQRPLHSHGTARFPFKFTMWAFHDDLLGCMFSVYLSYRSYVKNNYYFPLDILFW